MLKQGTEQVIKLHKSSQQMFVASTQAGQSTQGSLTQIKPGHIVFNASLPHPACNMSGLKDARVRLLYRVFSGPVTRLLLNAKRFDENLFTCQCEKDNRKA